MKKLLSQCTFSAFIFLFNLFIMSPMDAQTSERYEQIKNLHEHRIAESIISISGDITDVDGKKLDNIELSITFTRPKDMWATDSVSVHETKLVNGGFFIEKKHYTSVTISFLKQGYYPQTTTFYTRIKANEKDSAIQNGIQIKLRKIGPVAELIEIDKDLIYDIKAGTKSWYNLTDIPKISSDICKINDKIQQKKYLFLDFCRDEKGEIIMGKANAPGTNALAPETYILHFISPNSEDGLIFLDNDTPIADMTYLTEAPLKGYTSKELKISFPLDKTRYFYIKCGKFYGKGKIIYLDARNSEFSHVFRLSMELLFNKEPGNRNVRSEQK